MDRTLVFPGALPRSMDFLQFQKDAVYGLGYLGRAVLGTNTVVDGLVAAPTSPNTLNITVGAGSIYAVETMDATAYGVLGVDSNTLVKQGLLLSPVTLTITPPSTSGYSQVFLVEAAYEDVDGGSTVLPYYNSANPSVPYAGPANAGTSNYTIRQGQCVIALKAGTAAPTGSQTTPSPDVGYTGLYAVTVANGASSVTSGNIAALSTAPFINLKLPGVPAAIQAQAANYAVDTGTANALAVTLPAYTSVAAGLTLRIRKSSTPNTGACTLTVNGGTAQTIQWADGTVLASGIWPMNAIGTVTFDGSVWELTSLPGPSVYVPSTKLQPTGSIDFYVNGAIGNDSNDGLSNTAGHAFATIVGAVSSITSRYLALGTANVHVSDGTYNGFTINSSGVAQWNFIGDVSTPSNCIVSATSGSVNAGVSVAVFGGANVTLTGFRFQSYYWNIDCNGSHVVFPSGSACQFVAPSAGGYPCIAVFYGGSANIFGSHTFTGAMLAFVEAAQSGTIQCGLNTGGTTYAFTLTAVSSPSFTNAFAIATTGASISFEPTETTFSGTAIGARYNATLNGTINTSGSGASYLPGNSSGTTSTGGQYA